MNEERLLESDQPYPKASLDILEQMLNFLDLRFLTGKWEYPCHSMF
jgi:hypothetical protein